jgi:hypothetical protein
MLLGMWANAVVAPGLVFAGLLAAGRAQAEPWLEAQAGVALLSGHYSWERTSADRSRILLDEGGPIGIAPGIDLTAGYGFNREVAMGLRGHVELAPYTTPIDTSGGQVSGQVLASVGPALAVRPGRSLEVGISVDYTVARLTGSENDMGQVPPLFDTPPYGWTLEDVRGVSGSLWLGCCGRSGFGVAMVGRAARLTGTCTTYIPISFAIAATYSTW